MDKELSARMAQVQQAITNIGKIKPKKYKSTKTKTLYKACESCGKPVAVQSMNSPSPTCGDCRDGIKYLHLYNEQKPRHSMNIRDINRTTGDYEGRYYD